MTLVEYAKEGRLVVQGSLIMSISMRRGLHSKKDLGMEVYTMAIITGHEQHNWLQ